MGMKVYFISLGCPKNLVDSEVMLGILTEHHYEIINSPDLADVIVINTCSFIHDAKQESIDAILEMIDYKKPGIGNCKKLVVTGCLPQRYIKELALELPEVDLFVGTSEYGLIVDFLKQESKIHVNDDPSFEYLEKTWRFLTTPSHMAWLKVGEGCDRHCTFCIIPKLRGRYKSRKVPQVLNEAKWMVDQNVKEIILVAQDLSVYGSDLDEKNTLFHLLRGLEKMEQVIWIRLMYFYPDELKDDLIRKLKSSSKICKYLDIPVQHFSNNILKRMNRNITGEIILEKINRIKTLIPEITLRTSIIVGFPGETPEDFQMLLEGIKKAKFHHLGVFPYSDEDGTAAFKMSDKIAESVIQKRLKKVYEVQKKITTELNHTYIGKTVKVVIEGVHSETDLLLVGRHEGQAPEIDGKVIINDLNGKKVNIGDFVDVKISDVLEYDLIGTVV
ncbi:MAG: ribosomal protein S12 methylthiotransferase RimO [Bdellovibrionales bacterium RIFOXYB1_FULL_37_110]|nr:MAG: ribosomal protein S12 methylthiotransferase RimO [Bdellovibrionales bacterium RIFOXYA1_FULL_38_20]OFZ48912.1 MAG: ribosomal protein S12 methylthiotransferase RimO [Bdellovibrionales bacterium RIFOXYC1_FULL_37_79]OFZ59589.1 MAG: ribosomal protein S12 methylthiotransferase RimO [Bdellovibrionales bacterium RIFOXYB1_FULL_37_110]OFZ62432.1 MAG: ribosomal protein S12 methylthiotransferase RimO [Bdellovibrionales bacterium RIFOXYD1_FULL_36_51]